MANINILPTHLVNRIAAGEVIERPASVVKELVENAIDAGATSIDVTVEDGGRKLITVADNGCGMGESDAAKAFLPHATSKIATDDDLFNIHTMGFRGEALASIASISHTRLRTRRAEDEAGWEVTASGDTVDQPRPAAGAPGTTISVGELFFNTPARRKFMRTANTEMGHISEQLTRLALPHPHVAFTLTHNGRHTLHLPVADSTRRRISDLLGTQLAADLLPISAARDTLSIDGLIAPPAAGRGSSKWQYVFLNGRYIRDRLLSHALREAYRGLIDPNRWPVVFAFLQIDPDCVDVNVHPTKVEVRFRDSQVVHSALLGAMRDTLNRAALAVPAAAQAQSPAAEGVAADGDQTDRQQSLRAAMADFFKAAPKTQPRLGFDDSRSDPQSQRRANISPSTIAPGGAGGGEWISDPGDQPSSAADPSTACQGLPQLSPAPPSSPQPTDFRTYLPPTSAGPAAAPFDGAAIQIDNTYIVAATADGLIIVDQHALHERIIYNDLKGRLAAAPLVGQRLLLPETLTVTAAEADLLARSGELLLALGIAVEPFGPDAVAIQQFPTLLAERGVEAGDFLRGVLDALAEDETAGAERLLESLLEMIACKAAVKAGDPLTAPEMAQLLTGREHAEKASACPHGRPTTLALTLADLQKQFKRT